MIRLHRQRKRFAAFWAHSGHALCLHQIGRSIISPVMSFCSVILRRPQSAMRSATVRPRASALATCQGLPTLASAAARTARRGTSASETAPFQSLTVDALESRLAGLCPCTPAGSAAPCTPGAPAAGPRNRSSWPVMASTTGHRSAHTCAHVVPALAVRAKALCACLPATLARAQTDKLDLRSLFWFSSSRAYRSCPQQLAMKTGARSHIPGARRVFGVMPIACPRLPVQ